MTFSSKLVFTLIFVRTEDADSVGSFELQTIHVQIDDAVEMKYSW